MRFAIQTLLVPGASLAEKFDNAVRYGFDGIELAVGPDFDLADHFKEAEQASANSGLPICAICTHPIHDPIVPDPLERQRRLKALADLVDMAEHLGANGVVSVPVRPPLQYPDLSPWMDRLSLLNALTIESLKSWSAGLPQGKAAVFLEPLNRYEAYFLNRVGHAVEIARAVNHPRVRALADLFHMNIEEADLGLPIKAAGADLGHVHIADNNRFQPGRGCLNFRPAFAALKAINYSGYISIECWSPRGPVIEGDPEVALPTTVRFMRDEYAQA